MPAADDCDNREEQGGAYVMNCLGSLSPLVVDANGTAESTGKTNEAIVEVGPAEAGGGDGEIGKVRQELELAGSTLTKRSTESG